MELNVAEGMMIVGDLCNAGEFAQAESILRQIAAAESDNVQVFNMLGIVLNEQDRPAEALPCFDRAGMLLQNELVSVTCNRGRSLVDMGMAAEALQVFTSLTSRFPGHLIARFNRGLVLLQMGRCAEAIVEFDAVLAQEPGNGKAAFSRGFANLVMGNYQEGFRDYECRLKDEIQEPNAELWTGVQDLAGKTILVHGEQGLGDNIMFARYLPLLVARGASVLVWVPKSVRPLLAHLPITLLGDDREIWPRSDYWVRFMSLAYCFGTKADTVPPPAPLFLPGANVNRFADIIRNSDKDGRSLRVGLCWSGSSTSKYDAHRSIWLNELRPLLALDGVQFYSLQLGVRDRDRTAFQDSFMVDLAPFIEDFADTAAAMANLDAVVTVDTSVAHLAGTVGVPTYIMLTAFRTYWLWIEKLTTSPWYPSARLFRQPVDGEWAPVVGAVQEQLSLLRVG